MTNETAALYIRAMIAAAAADGRIDAAEQAKIMGGLNQAGMGADARAFLQNELNNPATAADLAAGCKTPEQAVQVFTAARFAIELDEQGEADFLNELAGPSASTPTLPSTSTPPPAAPVPRPERRLHHK